MFSLVYRPFYYVSIGEGGQQYHFKLRYLIFKRLLPSSGISKKIRVDPGSCFLSLDLKSFFENHNIKTIYCTIGDHRSNGLVERLVNPVKSKLLTMSFDLPKHSLNSSIKKIIWNLITKQASMGCTPFKKHFNRMANTRWKNRISLDTV